MHFSETPLVFPLQPTIPAAMQMSERENRSDGRSCRINRVLLSSLSSYLNQPVIESARACWLTLFPGIDQWTPAPMYLLSIRTAELEVGLSSRSSG